jgi:tetratricopeptide (TPR) repeat protein
MTEPEETQAVPENEPQEAAAPAPEAATGPEAAAPPEPRTPERVSEWNAYYDIYVMAAALLLAFVVSCNYVAESHIFSHLKTGQLINARSAPLMTDDFSYSESGRRWVDVPWLFQWAAAALYNFVYGLVPTDPTDPTANREKADQIAIGALVILDALVRLATAWVLLKVRHRGPGLWWSAVCVTLAFGVIYHPLFGIFMGGIAGVPSVGPATWGQLFLALELLVLFRALGQGRGGSLWLLIPLFLLWANWDASFLIGLVILAVSVLGRALDGAGTLIGPPPTGAADDGQPGELAAANPTPARVSTALVVLGLCAAACLVNPWTYRAYVAALDPFFRLFQATPGFVEMDLLSFFGPGIQSLRVEGESFPNWYLLPAYYLILVAVGLGSFLLNAARFSWARFLPFAVISVLWGIMMRYSAEYATIFAAVVALNGQEWYQSRFGTEGRLGRMWALWSTGGRLVTLALIFIMVSKDITGWRNTMPGLRFGVGYDPDDFPFQAAEFLEQRHEITGNVLNTSMRQGDILIWKAYPKRKTYIDARPNLFSRDLIARWHQTRKALSEDDERTWKPLLDQYGITVVMIEPGPSSNTYRLLMTSPNWIPFYDDGQIVMFGRSDAPASDLAVFKAHRLEPDRVYRTSHPVPAAEGPPTATSWIDDVFQNRVLNRPQKRTESARRWLSGQSVAGEITLPEPARCLLAIQDARTALARSPDDWIAFRMLDQAYASLMVQEAALLAGIPLTPENQARISQLTPSPELLMNRFRQRVTALNYAIQTTPPPRSKEARQELFTLNLHLFQLYLSANARDLARDRLQTALDLTKSDDYPPPEVRATYQTQLDQLNQLMDQVQERLLDLSLQGQASDVDQAFFALRQGAVGLAITQFAKAERESVSLALVKPQLIDLYCLTGQPDKALDLLSVGTLEDAYLGTEPGAAYYRQGLVYYLLGNYLSSASLWQDRALPRVRFHRNEVVMAAGRNLVHGEGIMATTQFLGLPGTLGQQASWEYDLAICQLEAGLPEAAAEHFKQALTLEPDLTVRPIVAYYLEKLGKPVPPPSKRAAAAAAKTSRAVDQLLSPTVSLPSPAPGPGPSPGPQEPPSTSKPSAPQAKETPAAPDRSVAPGKAKAEGAASKGAPEPR